MAIVLCGNPFKSAVWNKGTKEFTVTYTQSRKSQIISIDNTLSNFEDPSNPYSFFYAQGSATLTATEGGVLYTIEFNFESGIHKFGSLEVDDLPYFLTKRIVMGGGISVTTVVIIGALYYFLAALARSPIDAAKEKKAKLPKKDSKSGKLPIKGKASKVKDSKDEKLPKK